MAVIEATIGRIIGFALDWLGRLLARRPVVRIRHGIHEEPGVGFGFATEFGVRGTQTWTRAGAFWIHNGGRERFTVNQAGWGAKDGSLLMGDLAGEHTLEPGGPELRVNLDALEIVTHHEAHGGIEHALVTLAGETEPRRKRVPQTWIADVRSVATKPTSEPW